jgi:hypothetical protein
MMGMNMVYPQINSLLFSKVENYNNFQSRKHIMFIEKKKENSLSCSIFIFQPFVPPKTSVVAGPRAKRPLLEPRRHVYSVDGVGRGLRGHGVLL